MSEPPTAPSPARLLVVEDDRDLRTLLVDLLRREGYRTEECDDGADALVELRRARARYDGVLLDLDLPKVDGFQVLEQLHKRPLDPPVPVLVLTASGREADVVTCLDLGARDYVEKPYRPAELLARLRRHVLPGGGDGASETAAPPAGSSLEATRIAPPLAPGQAAGPAVASVDGKARLFGRYRQLEMLGRGSWGTVFKAWDEDLEQVVAVKVLRDLEELDRHRREARMARGVSSPFLARVFDFVTAGDDSALIMEYVPGVHLGAVYATTGALPPRVVLPLLRDMLHGLREAHAAGIVHRDLKPSNVMVTADHRAVVLDFGLALAEGEVRITRHGSVVGTPAYLPPEAARGQDAGPSGDVYSVGCILYELLGGRRTFTGKTAADVLVQRLERDPEPLSSLRPGLPPELAAVVMRCLERDPGARPRDADDLLAALDGVGGLDWGSCPPRDRPGPGPARPQVLAVGPLPVQALVGFTAAPLHATLEAAMGHDRALRILRKRSAIDTVVVAHDPPSVDAGALVAGLRRERPRLLGRTVVLAPPGAVDAATVAPAAILPAEPTVAALAAALTRGRSG